MTNPTDSSTTPPTGGRRRNILLAILGLLIVGLVYDFAVARPAVEQAYATVTAKNVDFNAERKHQAMRDTDIREILGREPARTFDDGGLIVEVYSWQSGLPFRTHDLFVVYRRVKGENFLVRLTKFAHDPDEAFRGAPVQQAANEESEGEPPTDSSTDAEPAAAEPDDAKPADDEPANTEQVGDELADTEDGDGEQAEESDVLLP